MNETSSVIISAESEISEAPVKLSRKVKLAKRKELFSLGMYLANKTRKRAEKLQERAARKAEREEAAKK